jgi:positive regulator of sigma E activity
VAEKIAASLNEWREHSTLRAAKIAVFTPELTLFVALLLAALLQKRRGINNLAGLRTFRND